MTRDWDVRVQKRSAAAVDLLSRAAAMLRAEAATLIGCHSELVEHGDDYRPVPGTIAADVVPTIKAMIDLIREIEAHLIGEQGAKLSAGPEDWLDDILAYENGWEGGQL